MSLIIKTCICKKTFERKWNFERHVEKCKIAKESTPLELLNFGEKNSSSINLNLNFNINYQPLNILSFNDTKDEDMYTLIQKYSEIENHNKKEVRNTFKSKSVEESKFIISNYLNKILTPKNMIKHFPRNNFQIIDKVDENNQPIFFYGSFLDSVKKLESPIQKALIEKLKLFHKIIVKNDDYDENSPYDYELYKLTIKAFLNEIKDNKTIQNVLKHYLKFNISTNMQLKMIQ